MRTNKKKNSKKNDEVKIPTNQTWKKQHATQFQNNLMLKDRTQKILNFKRETLKEILS